MGGEEILKLLVPVGAGAAATLLVRYLLQRKTARQQSITNAIELLDEVSRNLSLLFESLIHCIVNGVVDDCDRMNIAKGFQKVMTERFSVEIKGKAYLGHFFSTCYRDLTEELLRSSGNTSFKGSPVV